MMHRLTILLCLTSWIVVGQNKIFQNPDDLYDFHGFTFGMAPDDLPGSLQLDLTISFGLKYYKYRDKSVQTLYNRKVYDINLGFRDDQLEYIDIYFNKLDQEAFDTFRNQLEVRFGSSTLIDAVEPGIINAVQWDGNEVTIDLYRYGDEPIDNQDKNKTVLAISRLISEG